ncbi:hypothetical protein B0H65DRAFT_146364 [Neurospora tetraspora]|uniref:Uncharacterized protein n=1 Tax=Neurospora tetraspora TaxID=94610 RepID=A0AAE0JGB4_9PEZI|nr:hypothetical protein B0H65DRAFT_146364 [Neurospora tetraspora]
MAYPPRKVLNSRLTFLALGLLLLGIFPQPIEAVHRYNESQCCLDAVASEVFTLNVTRNPKTGEILSSEAPICGQMYNDTLKPAPEIRVSYAYCKSNCGGFGLSKGDEPGQWAAPIVQFLLPSVIFSMNVPRRHILLSTTRFNDWVWRILSRPGDRKPRKVVALLMGIVLLALDTLIGALDALLWIVVVMGMAGPMMVGGLHEAVLDYKIVRALKEGAHKEEGTEKQPPTLKSLRDTVEVLVTAISGNLVMGDNGGNPEVEIKKALLAEFPEPDCEVLNDQRPLSSQDTIGPVPQLPPIARLCQAEPSEQDGSQEPEGPPIIVAPPEIKLQPVDIEASKKLRERLTRLISSQLDFAATIGAPVVFYLGAFIYTILDIRNKPSDQDAAISLAFGVEWMIIVHVAIIGGCLLASNNPSPVVLLVGKEAPEDRGSTKDAQWIYFTRKNAFDGLFQPVNMWKRGINKSNWLRQSEVYRKNKKFRDRVKIQLLEYFGWIILQTFILISLPPAAGAFVAWRTPPIGWSCRSLSFVTYSASQLLLTLVYSAYLNMWERDQARHKKHQGEDAESGQRRSRNTYQVVHERAGRDASANGYDRPLEDLQQVHTASSPPRLPSLDMDMDDEEDTDRGRYELKEIRTTTKLLPSTPSPGPSSRHIEYPSPDPGREPNSSQNANLNPTSSPPATPRASMTLLQSNFQGQTCAVHTKPKKSLLTFSIHILFTTLFLLSLFLSIGTTLMQIMGVYRNCFCYITVRYWFDTSNPDAKVNVASDTWFQRNSSYNWMVMGGVATAFMAACAYAGWWFQGMIRRGLAGVVAGEVWPGYGNEKGNGN